MQRLAPSKGRGFALLTVLCCLGLCGCVSMPPVPAAAEAPTEALAAHVQFLAQPALKGRKPGTHGSRLARQYIESRFRAYGLVPWRPATSYALPFGFVPFAGGRNLVGVLPGSDPKLANEWVLVSAHYDHLGKDRKGRVCPGAADDASGIAALLESAHQLAQGPRPKRSLLFVAFDCEEQMCFGAFAFCCRPEVQQAKLVGVVNLDVLGRDFLEVVHHTLFVSGTEPYLALRATIRQAGTAAGLRVLPIGTDLVGPRGDHIAFESRNLPCLFFSSGMYQDYHLPTDTADKLNYADIARSAAVVVHTLQALANELTPPPAGDNAQGFAEELRTVQSVMAEVNRAPAQAGVKPADLEAFKQLAAEAERMLSRGQYDRPARMRLASQAAGTLAPYLLPGDEPGGADHKDLVQMMQFLEQFYILYRLELLEGYHQLVAHLLQYRPGPFRSIPDFNYEVCHFTPEDISLVSLGGDRQALHVLFTPLLLQAHFKTSKWLLPKGSISLGVNPQFIDCEGTREDLTDYCLLALRAEQTNQAHYARLSQVLQAVTGASSTPDYPHLLAQRLRSGGFRDEPDWLSHCLTSGNPGLANAAMEPAKQVKGPRLRQVACRLLLDPKTQSHVRAGAIDLALQHPDKTVLLALCDVLHDPAPAYKKEYLPLLRADYPFAERLDAQALRPLFEKGIAQSPDAKKTLGELAAAGLKRATKKDFGQDSRHWRQWVERNVR